MKIQNPIVIFIIIVTFTTMVHALTQEEEAAAITQFYNTLQQSNNGYITPETLAQAVAELPTITTENPFRGHMGNINLMRTAVIACPTAELAQAMLAKLGKPHLRASAVLSSLREYETIFDLAQMYNPECAALFKKCMQEFLQEQISSSTQNAITVTIDDSIVAFFCRYRWGSTPTTMLANDVDQSLQDAADWLKEHPYMNDIIIYRNAIGDLSWRSNSDISNAQ